MLPCPHCHNPLIVTYDKQDKLNKCDCLACGFNCLLKHYHAIAKDINKTNNQ